MVGPGPRRPRWHVFLTARAPFHGPHRCGLVRFDQLRLARPGPWAAGTRTARDLFRGTAIRLTTWPARSHRDLRSLAHPVQRPVPGALGRPDWLRRVPLAPRRAVPTGRPGSLPLYPLGRCVGQVDLPGLAGRIGSVARARHVPAGANYRPGAACGFVPHGPSPRRGKVPVRISHRDRRGVRRPRTVVRRAAALICGALGLALGAGSCPLGQPIAPLANRAPRRGSHLVGRSSLRRRYRCSSGVRGGWRGRRGSGSSRSRACHWRGRGREAGSPCPSSSSCWRRLVRRSPLL